MKTEVTLETINANDLQARITAAIQSGTGPDIIMLLHNWPHLYQSALADFSDLCDWKGKDQGGYYGQSEAAARNVKRWLAPVRHRGLAHHVPEVLARRGGLSPAAEGSR